MRVLEELARLRTLLVAFAVIIVLGTITVSVEPRRPDGSIDSGLSDLVFGVLGPLSSLAWLAAVIAHKVCFYRRIESYESRDASLTPVALTPHLYAQQAELLGRGFQPVGQLESRWPWQSWKMACVFTNPAYRIDTAIGTGPFPCFESHWADVPSW